MQSFLTGSLPGKNSAASIEFLVSLVPKPSLNMSEL